MEKKQWKNLYRAYRKMRGNCGSGMAMSWIRYYNRQDSEVLKKLGYSEKREVICTTQKLKIQSAFKGH